MPEGDTLRRLAERITARFSGQLVQRSELRDPRLAGRELAGARLTVADAYGKHLFVRFDDARTLHAHLLMDGSFVVGPVSRAPDWRRRVELWLENGRLTGEDVPVLELIATGEESRITAPLGPDLCAVAGAPDPALIAARLAGDPAAPLAGAMLDQRIAAGWGNLYVNEVPFIVGVSPFQPIGSVTGLTALVAIGTALIRVNARRGPQNTTGRRLASDERWVHGVGRRPCPVCGTRLEYRDGDHTPWRRTISWCPACQPAVDAATVDLVRARRLIALHPAVKEPYFPR
jgi:formamidopyrimidine-DNA glycosylase